MVKFAVIAAFWAIAVVACLRPTSQTQRVFLASFFGLMVPCGLSHGSAWPFFAWDMWAFVSPSHVDWSEILLVDSADQEWRYDFSAVPPASPTIIEGKCSGILMEHGEKASQVAQWLLRRARLLREAPTQINPRWWTTDLGFLPVGPASRESCAGWASDPTAKPAEFVELVVKKRRLYFSTPAAPARQEIIAEKRFPWIGS